MDLNRKTSYLILSIILFLSFLINITTFKNGHNWENDDFSAYLSQTRSLADGTIDDLVSGNSFLIEHSTKDTGTLIGPWGFPILLSPVNYLFGPDIHIMKMFTNFFFILSLLVVFLLFQDRLKNVDNLLLIAIIAFNTWFFDFKDNLLSDIPFMFFSLVSLFFIKRVIVLKKIWINSFLSLSLVGLSIYLSYSIRSVGLVLLPTLFIAQFIEHRHSAEKKPFVLDNYSYVPYVVFILCAVLVSHILPTAEATSAYLNKFSQLSLNRLIFDIKYYSLLPSRFFPFLFLNLHGYGFEYNKFSLVLYAVILLCLFIGIIKNAKKDYLFLFYMLITLPVIMLFSSRQGFRLLIPVFPFFLYFLFKGLSTISLSIEIVNNSNPFKIGIIYLFCAGLVIISFMYTAHQSYQNMIFNRTHVIEGPYSDDSTGLFSYIKENTDKNDVILFYKPRTMFYFTGRKSFDLNRSALTVDQLLKSPADYLACEKNGNPYNLTTEALRNNFNCAYENDTFILCSLRSNSGLQD